MSINKIFFDIIKSLKSYEIFGYYSKTIYFIEKMIKKRILKLKLQSLKITAII